MAWPTFFFSRPPDRLIYAAGAAMGTAVTERRIGGAAAVILSPGARERVVDAQVEDVLVEDVQVACLRETGQIQAQLRAFALALEMAAALPPGSRVRILTADPYVALGAQSLASAGLTFPSAPFVEEWETAWRQLGRLKTKPEVGVSKPDDPGAKWAVDAALEAISAGLRFDLDKDRRAS